MDEEQRMGDVFIVTSVIHAESVFDSNTRVQQTMSTIQSIQETVPNVKIILVEGSLYQWSIPDIDVIYVDVLGVAKSAGEAFLIKAALESPAMINMINQGNVSRIYKLSGRYWLTSDFHLDLHQKSSHILACCFQQPYVHTQTVLYSFPMHMYNFMIHQMDYAIHQVHCRGISIEECILEGVPNDMIMNQQRMGVEGYVSPTGEYFRN